MCFDGIINLSQIILKPDHSRKNLAYQAITTKMNFRVVELSHSDRENNCKPFQPQRVLSVTISGKLKNEVFVILNSNFVVFVM